MTGENRNGEKVDKRAGQGWVNKRVTNNPVRLLLRRSPPWPSALRRFPLLEITISFYRSKDELQKVDVKHPALSLDHVLTSKRARLSRQRRLQQSVLFAPRFFPAIPVNDPTQARQHASPRQVPETLGEKSNSPSADRLFPPAMHLFPSTYSNPSNAALALAPTPLLC